MGSDWLDEETPAKSRGGRPLVHGRGRQRKIECEECGCIARMSAGAIAAAGLPTCGCGGAFIVPELRDRFATDPGELERELRDQAFMLARDAGATTAEAEERERVAWNDALRQIGARHLIVPPRAGESRGGSKTCDYAYCTRFTAGRYCDEHETHRPELAAARRSL